MALENVSFYDEFIELITSSPTLEQVANFRLSEAAEARISTLLEANQDGTISQQEKAELDDYLRVEHIMRNAKIRAFEKLDQQNS